MIPVLPFSNTTTANSGINDFQNYFFLFFFAIILFRVLLRGVKGRTYSKPRVLRRPITYLIFTAILGISLYVNIYYLLMVAVAFIPGLVFGDKFGRLSQVYSNGSQLMYRSNIVVMAVWGISFIARIFIQFEYPTSIDGIFITELLLSFTSGILFGEAYHIINKVNEMGSTPSPNDTQFLNS